MSTWGLHTGGATSPHRVHKSLEECLGQVVPLKHQSLFQLCNCSWLSPGSYPTPNFVPDMFNRSHILGKWRPWKNVVVVVSETRHRHPCCVRTCIVLLEDLQFRMCSKHWNNMRTKNIISIHDSSYTLSEDMKLWPVVLTERSPDHHTATTPSVCLYDTAIRVWTFITSTPNT